MQKQIATQETQITVHKTLAADQTANQKEANYESQSVHSTRRRMMAAGALGLGGVLCSSSTYAANPNFQVTKIDRSESIFVVKNAVDFASLQFIGEWVGMKVRLTAVFYFYEIGSEYHLPITNQVNNPVDLTPGADKKFVPKARLDHPHPSMRGHAIATSDLIFEWREGECFIRCTGNATRGNVGELVFKDSPVLPIPITVTGF